jgi:hypothetical protein
MMPLDNEEVLTAFREYLQAHPLKIADVTTEAKALAILREFATAIDPVPLAEATLQEIKVFERDHKVPAVSVRPAPLSPAHARDRYLKALQELRYHEIQIVMLYFRGFRDSVLGRLRETGT